MSRLLKKKLSVYATYRLAFPPFSLLFTCRSIGLVLLRKHFGRRKPGFSKRGNKQLEPILKWHLTGSGIDLVPDSSTDNDNGTGNGNAVRTIKLTLEYDGTEYVGWQVQNNGPSIQGTINVALGTMTGEEIKVAGASRTDSGVHALSQCAVFVTCSAIPVEGFMGGLNSLLPEDIVVTEAVEVEASFDPRRDSRGKVYVYRVLNRDYRSPLLRRSTWFVRSPLDIARMQEATKFFSYIFIHKPLR